MNSRKIERAKLKLQVNGVVPLDEIFELVGEGINFRDLDNKYNKFNKTYEDRPPRKKQTRLEPQ